MGPDPSHGTHVAGIIGAARNGQGMDGIAAGLVRIMAIRTVPNGDERDKDVANAIRYAVDEGAQIINMSFGKSFSPSKSLVDAAVRYADERGVLMVHAAGNDGEDMEVEDNYPNPDYDGGGRAAHWISVGGLHMEAGQPGGIVFQLREHQGRHLRAGTWISFRRSRTANGKNSRARAWPPPS